MSDRLNNNGARQRFERTLEGGTAFASYRLGAGTVAILHTEVPLALRGSGVGSTFVREVLQEIRRLGLKVEPQCSFVRAFMAKNPEFNDLLP
jgi:predicted GNAT family acetyltransferase